MTKTLATLSTLALGTIELGAYLVTTPKGHVLVDGGRSDYLFGKAERGWFEKVKVDRTLKDGDTISRAAR